MNFLGIMGKKLELPKLNNDVENKFSNESLNKFDKIMGDDNIKIDQLKEEKSITSSKAEDKFNKLFDTGDYFKRYEIDDFQDNDGINGELQEVDLFEKRELNSQYEINGSIYETDDNGYIYKKNGELLSDKEYTVSSNKYRTDEYGNKISCDSEPIYTEDGTRNIKEQKEIGGDERREDDDGGHIIAKILGGTEGQENLVPMRRTINRGDYKKMENEISKVLQEGKHVILHIDLEYNKDSRRPSKIISEYIIDEKKTVIEFDNKENSIELLDLINDKISDDDFNNLKEEFDDMKADGINGSITSVKIEYNENESPVKITVGVLDESTGMKSYKVYEPK